MKSFSILGENWGKLLYVGDNSEDESREDLTFIRNDACIFNKRIRAEDLHLVLKIFKAKL